MFRSALIAAALVIAASAPAAAHTDLESSDPADGVTLQAPPEQVTLRFGEDLLTEGDKLVAKDDTGVQVGLGPSQVNGPKLSATWPSTAAAGNYTVSYRAVAADGHPLEGRITFTIATESAAPQPSPVAAPESARSATNPWLIAAPVLLVAALAAGGLYVWRTRE